MTPREFPFAFGPPIAPGGEAVRHQRRRRWACRVTGWTTAIASSSPGGRRTSPHCRAQHRRTTEVSGPDLVLSDHNGRPRRPSLSSAGPRPHVRLQAVAWLISGELLQLDGLGGEQLIRPGQLNLMTAGHSGAHVTVRPTARTRTAARAPGGGGATVLGADPGGLDLAGQRDTDTSGRSWPGPDDDGGHGGRHGTRGVVAGSVPEGTRRHPSVSPTSARARCRPWRTSRPADAPRRPPDPQPASVVEHVDAPATRSRARPWPSPDDRFGSVPSSRTLEVGWPSWEGYHSPQPGGLTVPVMVRGSTAVPSCAAW